jgi:hypothetical protein
MQGIHNVFPMENSNENDGVLVACLKGPVDFSSLDAENGRFKFIGRRTRTSRTADANLIGKPAGSRRYRRDVMPIDQVLDAITKGRAGLALLLDTTEGSVVVMSKIMELVEAVRSNGGVVSAFAGQNVGTVGAQIFMSVDPKSRFATHQSELAFGLCKDDYREDGSLTRRGEDELVLRWNLLFDNSREDTREALLEVLRRADADTSQPARPVFFESDAIRRFGFADIPSDHGGSLRRTFEKLHGVKRSWYRGTRIDGFFGYTDLTDRIWGVRAA